MKHSRLDAKLQELQQNKTYRQSRTLDSHSYTINSGQQQLINFSSNDYLGLAGNQALQQDFFKQVGVKKDNWMSASSSRPLTGTSSSHSELESMLARSYNKSGALLFNSGYHANIGILPAITDRQDLVLADKFVHASLIDGLKLGQASFKRFAHNKPSHLEQLLDQYRHQYRDVWIVTESLFSMDGDQAPLAELLELKSKYQCYLYVDEAHAVGCFGEQGLGLAENAGVLSDIDLLIGTFGKALAGCGGFAVGNQTLIDSMINFSRSWLFSTALPPINIDWNMFVWQQLSDLKPQQEALTALSTLFRTSLQNIDKTVVGESHIIPMIEAGNENVIALSKKLEAQGILAMPIRSPTVPIGSERIRFSLTANMPESVLQHCIQSLSS